MFEYDKDAKQAVEILDKYDLTKFLYDCYSKGVIDILDILDVLEIKYPELETVLEDLTTDEFMEYICTKYNVRFAEDIRYRLYGVSKPMDN